MGRLADCHTVPQRRPVRTLGALSGTDRPGDRQNDPIDREKKPDSNRAEPWPNPGRCIVDILQPAQ